MVKKRVERTEVLRIRLSSSDKVRLQEIADPKVYKKRKRKERNQVEKFGNEAWWPAGERTPERMPQYQGRD